MLDEITVLLLEEHLIRLNRQVIIKWSDPFNLDVNVGNLNCHRRNNLWGLACLHSRRARIALGDSVFVYGSDLVSVVFTSRQHTVRVCFCAEGDDVKLGER